MNLTKAGARISVGESEAASDSRGESVMQAVAK